MKTKTIHIICLALCICIMHWGFAQENDSLSKNYLEDLSLEDLMNLELKIGTFTPSSITDLPVSVTLIDKEMIQATPARNILDLIEVYVPGASFVTHWLGPRVGVRGVLGDQNTSYLLLVNGVNDNMKSLNGPFYEIQNRDLNDIESIEIVRGPGSVTYGHGAIGGIINIKTLKEDGPRDGKIGLGMNTTYRYGNLFAQGGYRKKDFSLSFYGSVNPSLGQQNPEFFYIDRAFGYGYGFMGWQWGNKGLGSPAPNFYGDFNNQPQLKAQLAMQYKENLRLWLRYSDISYIKQQQETQTSDGDNFPGLQGRQFMSVLEYKPNIFRRLSNESKIGFVSQSNRDISFYQGKNAPFDDITQRNFSFSQNEYFIESLFNLELENKIKLALGGKFSYVSMGPEWGMDNADFIMSFPPPLRFVVYDSTHSGFYKKYGSMGIVHQVDERIDASQYSAYAEAGIPLAPFLSILLSGRMDKHQYADYAFSPRISLLTKINQRQNINIIVQRAVRYPTFNELYTFNQTGDGNVQPEVKESIECMYNLLISDNLYFNIAIFYNSIEQIAWLNEGYPDLIGTFNLIGAEAELSYISEKTKAGINASTIHQTKWDPKKTIEAYLSNIGPDSIDVVLRDFGTNRINNIPKHTIKFYINHNFGKNLQLHADCRFAWDYGQNDMLDSFVEIHDMYGTEASRTEMDHIYEVLKEHGYGKASFTSNISISFEPGFLNKSRIYIYGMNLLQFNHMRYVMQYWEEGNNRQYPRQVGFISEPASIGFKWVLNL